MDVSGNAYLDVEVYQSLYMNYVGSSYYGQPMRIPYIGTETVGKCCHPIG
jgi:hypothetical protein